MTRRFGAGGAADRPRPVAGPGARTSPVTMKWWPMRSPSICAARANRCARACDTVVFPAPGTPEMGFTADRFTRLSCSTASIGIGARGLHPASYTVPAR